MRNRSRAKQLTTYHMLYLILQQIMSPANDSPISICLIQVMPLLLYTLLSPPLFWRRTYISYRPVISNLHEPLSSRITSATLMRFSFICKSKSLLMENVTHHPERSQVFSSLLTAYAPILVLCVPGSYQFHIISPKSFGSNRFPTSRRRLYRMQRRYFALSHAESLPVGAYIYVFLPTVDLPT